jgi:hypothetical protein
MGQGVQETDAWESTKVPAVQLSHTSAPPALKVPGPQGMHASMPGNGACDPASHGLLLSEPGVSTYLPGFAGTHSVGPFRPPAGVLLKVPALQRLQAEKPVSLAK